MRGGWLEAGELGEREGGIGVGIRAGNNAGAGMNTEVNARGGRALLLRGARIGTGHGTGFFRAL